MKRWLFVIVAGALASCAGPKQALEVKTFQLRDAKNDQGEDPMVRAEKQRRLYGAVSVAEQSQRLGQYYTVLWQDASSSGPVQVVMDYQQGATASKVKREVRHFPAGSTAGTAEFSVTGDNFIKNGRVLAWRIALQRDGRELHHRQSYLWR